MNGCKKERNENLVEHSWKLSSLQLLFKYFLKMCQEINMNGLKALCLYRKILESLKNKCHG